MIKIVKGTYGHRVEIPDGGFMIQPVTPADPPLTLTKAQETRLVRLGIAEYASETQISRPLPASPEQPLDPLAYDDTMTVAQLKEVAIAHEVPEAALAGLRHKAPVIALIEQKKTGVPQQPADGFGDDDEQGDGEQPPQVTPEAPVQ